MTAAATVATTSFALRMMPAVFVLIWSTGFIVARYGMPHAPPMSFLAIRYALSAICFALWAFALRAAWPRQRAQWGHLGITGVLIHAGYLGGVWSAVKLGMGAGLDEAAMRARLQRIVALNLGALAVSALGLMLVVAGIVLR